MRKGLREWLVDYFEVAFASFIGGSMAPCSKESWTISLFDAASSAVLYWPRTSRPINDAVRGDVLLVHLRPSREATSQGASEQKNSQ